MELDTNPIEALDQGFLEFVRAYGSGTGAKLDKAADCTTLVTPIPFPVYNGVFLPKFGDDASKRIEEIHARLVASGKPFTWMLTPTSSPSNLEVMIRAKNPAFEVPLNGMETEIKSIAPEPELPSGVEIIFAEDEEAVAQYSRLYTCLFGAPTEDWIDPVIAAELELFHSGSDPFHRYVARENGEPIAAGMTLTVGDSSILHTLYTMKVKRGRGIGHAIIARAFNDERERGARSAVIWSGPDADKLYSRIGFRYVAKATVFGFE